MKLFIAHKIDLYGFHDSIYLSAFENGDVKEFLIEDIINFNNEIISYEISSLLTQCRGIYKGQLPYLTDISQLIKINTGFPKKSFAKNHIPWNFWNKIKIEIGDDNVKKLFKIIRSSTIRSEIIECLNTIIILVQQLYNSSIQEIKESNQFERFYKIENEIQQILNKCQVEGITINIDKYYDVLIKLEHNKDNLINKLRYKYKIIDLNHRSLRNYLIQQGFKISSKDYNYFNLISFLKATKINSELCNDIYTTLREKLDYENLVQYISEENDLIFPEFDCVGTVTSRILITSPHIQHLKRENRIIFKARNNFTLLYCDYNQFEPGILASYSKDEVMIALYNSEDVYANFSNYLFGTKSLRKEAKILFLSYLYGMSDNRLIATIEEIIKIKGITKEVSVAQFFSKFKGIEAFKNIECLKAIENGHIQSETSIRRNIKKNKNGKGKLSEKRFVLSQLIQGTASYILKKAIIETMKDKEIDFLIPMHDAVLYQVPSNKEREKKLFIEKCFIDNFKSICPEINARVDFKLFHE